MSRKRSSSRTASILSAVLALGLLASACTQAAHSQVGNRSDPGLAKGGSKPYGYVVIGDFGKGNATEEDLASQIEAFTGDHPFDALVTVGDNVYNSGDPADFDAAWNEPFGWVEDKGVTVVASLGNHDVRTDNGAPEIELFGMPGHWYKLKVGPVAFFVLDANQPDSTEQKDWLAQALQASKAPWKVAVFHQPAYSCGDHGSTAGVQMEWVALFEQYGVALVLNGHDHDYQRFAPINGVTYVVDGGGAAAPSKVGDCPEGTPDPVAHTDDQHSFLYLSATPKKITGEAISVKSGDIIDSFKLHNQAG